MKIYHTYFDPVNFFAEGNCNPNGVKKITKEILDYYIQRKACYTCRLEKSSIIPDCLTDCRFKLHFVNGHNVATGKGKGRACVETKITDFPGSVFLSRTQLVLNSPVCLDIGFIFRSRINLNISIDHIDEDYFNDSPENLALMIHRGENSHLALHAQITKKRSEFFKLFHEFQNHSEKSNRKVFLENKWKAQGETPETIKAKVIALGNEINTLMKSFKHSQEALDLIKEIQSYVDRKEIWIPDWIQVIIDRENEKEKESKNE